MKIDSYLRQIGSFESVWKTLKTIPLSKLHLKNAAIALSALAFVAVIYKTSRKPSKPGPRVQALPIRNAQAVARQAGNPEPIRQQEQLVGERTADIEQKGPKPKPYSSELENQDYPSKEVEPANLPENPVRSSTPRRLQNPALNIASPILFTNCFGIQTREILQSFHEQQQPTSNLPDNAGPINALPQNEEVADKTEKGSNQFKSQDENSSIKVGISKEPHFELVNTKINKRQVQESNNSSQYSKTSHQKKPSQAFPKPDTDLIESLDVESDDTVFGYLKLEIFPSDKNHASADERPQELLNNTPLLKDDSQLDQMFEGLYRDYLPKEEKHFVIESVFDRTINAQPLAQENFDKSHEGSQQIDSQDEQRMELEASESNSLSGSKPQALPLDRSNDSSLVSNEPSSEAVSQSETHINAENLEHKKNVSNRLEPEEEETPVVPNNVPAANSYWDLVKTVVVTPFVWIGETFWATASFLTDGLQTTVKAGNELVQYGKQFCVKIVEYRDDLIQYRQAFRDGIDLIPILMQAKEKGNQIGQAGTEWWNSPSAPYDPFTANLMKGFADEFGNNLHCLLINSLRLGGPQVTDALAQKLDIAGFAANQVKSKLLALSNPLGMMHLLLNLGQGAVRACNFLAGGLVVNLDAWIENFVRDKGLRAGLKPDEYDYYHATAAILEKTEAYEKCLEDFISDLAKQGIKDTTGWMTVAWDAVRFESSAPWYEQYETEHASYSYHIAKKAYLDECEKHKEILSKPAPDESRYKRAAFVACCDLELFLKNTVRKTLDHFLQVLDEQIDAGNYSEENNKGFKEIARELIYGEDVSEAVKKAREEAQRDAAATANIAAGFNKAVKDPLSLIPFKVPQAIKDRARAFAVPVNEVVGRAVGDIVVGTVDEALIESLGLKNLGDTFKGQPLQFNLDQAISTLPIDQDGKTAQLMRGIISCTPADEILAGVVRQIGGEMARRISTVLADAAAKQMRLNPKKYPLKTLITRVYDRSILQQLAYGTTFVTGPAFRFIRGPALTFGVEVTQHLLGNDVWGEMGRQTQNNQENEQADSIPKDKEPEANAKE